MGPHFGMGSFYLSVFLVRPGRTCSSLKLTSVVLNTQLKSAKIMNVIFSCMNLSKQKFSDQLPDTKELMKEQEVVNLRDLKSLQALGGRFFRLTEDFKLCLEGSGQIHTTPL